MFELEDDLRRGLTTHPGYRSLRCMLLTMLIDSGRLDEARSLFDQLAANDFAAFPKDNEWLFALGLLAESAASLGDLQRAEALYDQLSPYASLVALAASEVSLGPVDRPLGALAAAVGRDADAAAHFDSAIAACQRTGARPWLAHTQAAYAAMLSSRGHPEDRPRVFELATAARDAAVDMGMTALTSAGRIVAGTTRLPNPSISDEAARLTRREREVRVLSPPACPTARSPSTCSSPTHRADPRPAHPHQARFSSRTEVAAWAVREGLEGALRRTASQASTGRPLNLDVRHPAMAEAARS